MNPGTARLAVFGDPVAHSRSPWIHAEFGRQCGIALDYRAIHAPAAEFAQALDAFVAAGGFGANVTLPNKTLAHAMCADLGPRAKRAGAVNTLRRDGVHWYGENTDGSGLVADLRMRAGMDPAGRRVLLIGAGGAARGVLEPLLECGPTELVVANRSLPRAEALAAAFQDMDVPLRAMAIPELAEVGAFDLIINASAQGHAEVAVSWPTQLLHADACYYDLSYGAAAQSGLDWARNAGCTRVSDGLGMLVEQAADAFAIWFGQRPKTQSVLASLRSLIEAR